MDYLDEVKAATLLIAGGNDCVTCQKKNINL